MNLDFQGRCPGCLSNIGLSSRDDIPMCQPCYMQLLTLPINERMIRIAEFRRLGLMEDLVIQLEKLVQESKGWKGFDTRWSES